MKDHLIDLMATYKDKYQIDIHDFCIMDNHAHLLLHAPSAKFLGHFMRVVLSLSARYINEYFGRDSQVYRERYKSTVIIGETHIRRVIRYIYANRIKVGGTAPHLDYYCSAHWRLTMPHKFNPNAKTPAERRENRLAKLLDDYRHDSMPRELNDRDCLWAFVKEMLEFSHLSDVGDEDAFDRAHTFGEEYEVAYRAEVIRAYARVNGPPNYQMA